MLLLYRKGEIENENEIVLFENQNVKLEVSLKDETVWLTQAQMTELFSVKQNAIAEHISNIFFGGELGGHFYRNFR